jgi:NADH-quinone oxidoreductase subunit H
MLAGYASGSKWSLFGGVREAAQVVSYEVPRSLCVVVPVCVAGTLSLTAIGNQQVGWFWNWNVFHDPFTFAALFIFYVTATASCKRAPFDLAEAESELVAGFHTEYSGMRWSFFFLAEYASMFAVTGLAALLFCGGWHTGFLPFEPAERFGFWLGNLLNVAVFIGKGFLGVLVMMWMRWSLPRLRIDQVMMTCLKYFLPISCVLLVGVCAWQLFVPPAVGAGVRYVLAFGSMAFVLGVVLSAFALRGAGTAPPGELAGVWAKPTPAGKG